MCGDTRFNEHTRGGGEGGGGGGGVFWCGHQAIIFLFFWFTQLTCLKQELFDIVTGSVWCCCQVHIEGSWSEWCIFTIYHAWDTPFWSGTLDTWVLVGLDIHHIFQGGITSCYDFAQLCTFQLCCFNPFVIDFFLVCFISYFHRSGFFLIWAVCRSRCNDVSLAVQVVWQYPLHYFSKSLIQSCLQLPWQWVPS